MRKRISLGLALGSPQTKAIVDAVRCNLRYGGCRKITPFGRLPTIDWIIDFSKAKASINSASRL